MQRIKASKSRIAFQIANYLFFCLLVLLCIYPMWYIFVQSFSGAGSINALVWPVDFTLENYQKVFQLEGIMQAMLVSVTRTLLGTTLTVAACMLLGYLFSKREMPGRTLLYRLLVITMYVSGGLVPVYLTMKSYGLLNNFWVYILPNVVSAYYVILIKTFVEQLPASVEESAMLDGAGPLTIFARIILPMSMPIMATIAVYAAVGQWNSWFDNHIYTLTNKQLMTLQYMLYRFLNEAERLAKQIQALTRGDIGTINVLTPKGVRMTVTMITVVPVLFVYPFMQRYFVKGIMIGAVKG